MRYVLVLALVILGGACDGVQMPEGVSQGDNGDVRQPTATSGVRIQDSSETAYGSVPEGGRVATGVAGLDALPTATPTPTPGPEDAPEPTGVPTPAAASLAPESAPSPAPVPTAPDPERPPDPAPATEAVVSGVTLTVYSCLNDGTGSYCPEGQAMYSGQQVHRGAIACSWNWPIGQRLRIIGDPLDMIYTCLDRGGGLGSVGWIDVWFYDAHDPATQAWRATWDQYVDVELLY